MTARSGRRVKKRTLHEHNGNSSRSKGTKKSRNCRKFSSIRKSTELKSLRPQRAAAQNAINGFSQVSEFSTDGEEEEGSESYSSESDSSLWGTNMENKKSVERVGNEKGKHLADEKVPSVEFNDGAANCHKETEHPLNVNNRKRLILKLSIRNPVKSLPSESTRGQSDLQGAVASFPSGNSGPSSSGVSDFKIVEDCKVSECDSSSLEDANLARSDDLSCPKETEKSSSSDVFVLNQHENIPTGTGIPCNHNLTEGYHRNYSPEASEAQKSKPTILKIKSKKVLQDLTTVDIPASHGGDLASKYSVPVDHNLDHHAQEGDRTEFSHGTSNASIYKENVQSEFPDIATDATRRKRSLRFKATSREADVVNRNCNNGDAHLPTSGRSSEKQSRRALDSFPTRGMPTSRPIIRLRSSGNYNVVKSAPAERNSCVPPRKPNWLLLSEQEEGYRYIPQLGDLVVYLVQVCAFKF